MKKVGVKSEKGAVTLLVLVTILFFVMVLMSIYILVSNKTQSQIEMTRETRRVYEKETAEDTYKKYFGDNIVPIYTVEQLLAIGTDVNMPINEMDGKIYSFSKNSSYILMNDLEFDYTKEEFTDENPWIPIGNRYSGEYLNEEIDEADKLGGEQGGRFDGNGKRIIVKNYVEWSDNYEFSMQNGYSFILATPGTMVTGDNKKYSSDGKMAIIPVGFMISNVASEQSIDNGLVIKDNSGNEFVWVPLDEDMVYQKWSTIVNDNNISDDTLPQEVAGAESKIERYHGFYIARYEAGLPTTIDQGVASSAVRNVNEKPLSKKNVVPWNFIDYNYAKVNAESMYNTSSVISGLVTGTQWDTTMKWLENSGVNVNSSEGWGNAEDITVPNITEYSLDNGASWIPGTSKPQNTKGLLKTGNSVYTSRKNIYDLAGNVSEWSNEIYNNNYVLRGGNFWWASTTGNPLSRSRTTPTSTSSSRGFRVILYLK